MLAVRNSLDIAPDLGTIRRQVILSQIHPTSVEIEQARNRRIARQTTDFDITKDYGNLGPKYGIWGLGLG